jgi:hypothetical protein
MSRTVVMLTILTAGIGSLACANPPTPEVPARTSSSADQKSRDDTTQPNSSTSAAATTPAATTADSVPLVKPMASSSDQSQREALLLDQGYKPAMRNGEKVFCKREIPMGSRLPTALHCLTVAEAELIAKEGRETTERIQRSMVGCMDKASGGCGK